MTTSNPRPRRLSPLHEQLVPLRPTWGVVNDTPVALRCVPGDAESQLVCRLALADASALPRVTVKGPQAAPLLEELGLAAPSAVFAAGPQGRAGLAARTGSAEFFVEDGPLDDAVARIERAVGPFGAARPGLYRVPRADASILVAGELATDLFAQTCACDLRAAPPDRLIFTRVAGVSCSVLPRTLAGAGALQVWLDGTYGPYLWAELLEIARELGGGPVGLAAFFPDLSSPSSQTHP